MNMNAYKRVIFNNNHHDNDWIPSALTAHPFKFSDMQLVINHAFSYRCCPHLIHEVNHQGRGDKLE